MITCELDRGGGGGGGGVGCVGGSVELLSRAAWLDIDCDVLAETATWRLVSQHQPAESTRLAEADLQEEWGAAAPVAGYDYLVGGSPNPNIHRLHTAVQPHWWIVFFSIMSLGCEWRGSGRPRLLTSNLAWQPGASVCLHQKTKLLDGSDDGSTNQRTQRGTGARCTVRPSWLCWWLASWGNGFGNSRVVRTI